MCACRDHESGQKACSKNGTGDVRFFPAGTPCSTCQGGEQCFLVNGGAGGSSAFGPVRRNERRQGARSAETARGADQLEWREGSVRTPLDES